MRNRNDWKICGVLALCLLWTVCFLPSKAKGVIYVAGSSDHYPIEYYNEEEACFQGILPDILKAASEKSGLKFEYLSPAYEKKQYADNKQVEMVSDVDSKEANRWGLTFLETCVSWREEETRMSSGFALTEVATSQQRAAILSALDTVTEEEREEIFLKYAMEGKPGSEVEWRIPVLAAAAVLAAAVILEGLRRRKNKEVLEQMHQIDPVTGYGNYKRMKKDYESFVNDGNRALYCMVDLKVENMSQFHNIFDMEDRKRISGILAEVLAQSVRENEMMASVLGERFYLLLQYVSFETIQNKVEHMIERFHHRCIEEGLAYPFQMGCGIYHLQSSSFDLDECVYYADQARAYAVRHGKMLVKYSGDVGKEITRHRTMEREVFTAFQREEFVPYYQPILDIQTQKICGAETLARWNSRNQGFLAARHFINILEEHRMIGKLDLLIFEQVCKMLTGRNKNGEGRFPVFCNFSRNGFYETNLPEQLERLADRYGIPHGLLVIEVSERTLDEEVLDMLKKVKDIGFLLSLDHFGTGYDSFQMVERFPWNYIKLDRSVVKNVRDSKTVSVLRELIHVVHSLDAKVICEGVESREETDILGKLGCDMVQGYYYYQPLPKQELERML